MFYRVQTPERVRNNPEVTLIKNIHENIMFGEAEYRIHLPPFGLIVYGYNALGRYDLIPNGYEGPDDIDLNSPIDDDTWSVFKCIIEETYD